MLAAALYIKAVHYVYISYISPTFEYAHYIYIEPHGFALASTYFLCWVVLLLYRNTSHPAQAAAGFIYTLCYVPIQLSLLFTIDQQYSNVFIPQLFLAISMAAIFFSARMGPQATQKKIRNFSALDRGLGLLTIITILFIVIINRDHMRLVSFEEVYDLRSAAAEESQNFIVGYLGSWLSYCFISYFFARSITQKKWMYAILGIFGSIVLYMATGAKASILLLPMTIGVVALWKDGNGFLFRTLTALVAVILILTFLVPDQGAFLWAKSIALVRILGANGWSASKYFEYFDTAGHTYYTHIGPINAIFGGYPFGDYSLGQMIGIQYSGSAEANFNASFWATDGFAAVGSVGILFITPPLMILMYWINNLMGIFETRFSIAWLTGYLVAMLNVPFMTALLSGGGGIILILSWIIKNTQTKSSSH